jgi:hypothetical protein
MEYKLIVVSNMSIVYPELKAGRSVLVTKNCIEWVSSIVTSGGDSFYKVARTKLLSSRSRANCFGSYYSILPKKFDVGNARVVEFTKEELEHIRADLQHMIWVVKSIVESLDEVFDSYTGNGIPELLDKHKDKLPELRDEFKIMLLAALQDNKKIRLHSDSQANRMHKKDFIYAMLEPGSTKESIDEALKNWKLTGAT